jgi:hypothetical protein
MPVFRRSSAGETDSKADGSQAEQATDAPAQKKVQTKQPTQAGKGRPTPKRSEAERRRYQSIQGGTTSGRTPAATRDPARKLTPEEKAREKDRARSARAQNMERMQRGEGPRDAGPVRKFARDYVDSHRRFMNYWMIIIVLLLLALPTLGKFVQSYLTYIELIVVAILVVDGYLLGQTIKKHAAERFPGQSTQGIAWYAGMRAVQLRFMRMPKPRVKPGDRV